MRDVEAIATEYGGQRYRSRTEARWAVFFDTAGLAFEYERRPVKLSSGEMYLPDFYLPDLNAWFEVKGGSDAIVTEEATKARLLANDRQGERVWLAVGVPNPEAGNILLLDEWPHETTIEEILGSPENRYRFLEDRRDDRYYWLQADFVTGGFRHSFGAGGPGESTDHDRLPIMGPHIEAAYTAASTLRFG